MTIERIIDKKRLNYRLTKEELAFAVNGFVNGKIKDYQMSALLMAITINGMTDEETINLTEIILNSGDKIDLSSINGIKVDKHSTGGVGDKTTLVLIPLVASLGIPVAKMSGRGLGHTGGTIDKIESIKNFNVKLNMDDFINQVNSIGVALVSQTGNLVPADKKMYALRDVTATVESIPLIASSIMSKKLASGADKIVLDVKVGAGALMKTYSEAKRLAELMVKIGNHHGRETVCVLTSMSEPLGNAIGNALEVKESIDTLKGKGPKDLHELVLKLGSIMVSLAKNISEEEAYNMLEENLNNGKAYDKFVELVEAQGGDINKVEVSDKCISIKAKKTGVIGDINAYKMGEIVRDMGAGRLTIDDEIDHGVGIVLSKKVGDFVLENEELLNIYVGNKDVNVNEILDCYS
jgi:pyrimidine-nucleoside phosphorylase